MKRKLGYLGIIMLCIAALGAAFSYVFQKQDSFGGYVSKGRDETLSQTERELRVVTSFYPIYIIAWNLTEGVPGVRVENLTGNQTGCLHDYQLTTRDMRLLEQADAFLINGGGMEAFLEQAAEKLPELVILHSEEGIELLSEDTHTHEPVSRHIKRQEELTAGTAEKRETTGETTEKEHNHGAENAHIWMDPERYQAQIRNLAEGLITLDPEHRAAYEKNRDRYLEQVAKVQKEYQEAFSDRVSQPVIIFHEAFAYLAEVVPFEVIEAVELEGEEHALSPGELTGLIEEIRLHQIPYLLVEETGIEETGIEQQGTVVGMIAVESKAEIIALDPLTAGEEELASWLTGMRKNLNRLLEYWDKTIP